MNIEKTKINQLNYEKNLSNSHTKNSSNYNFSSELKELEEPQRSQEQVISAETQEVENSSEEKSESQNVESAIEDLNKVVEELNQSEENEANKVKEEESSSDKNDMINKDFSIKENDKLAQMQTNMNFDTNGQPFSSFMNNDKNKNGTSLGARAQDLAEEAAILSTMAENIAMANKNTMLKNEKVEVIDETGIKKVDSKTRMTVETVVKYDSIIMNQADVEIFAELVQKGELNLNNLTSQGVEKSMQISKTLADMLVKAKENNQPLRIDFDNDISVIIRISREGKIRADFLPSSQVAEAYLKENLPLLRQKFEDNNIDYESLNQRERKENPKDNNRKKGQKNE